MFNFERKSDKEYIPVFYDRPMLNIGVLLKSVPDTESKLISENGKPRLLSGKLTCNPFDEYAIEEAIRIKEKFGAIVTAVSLNNSGREDELRYALAMGADKALLIKTTEEVFDPLQRGSIIFDVISPLKFDLIIAGKEAIDDNFASVPVFVATELGYSFLTEVIEEKIDGESIVCRRLKEDSEEFFRLKMPALITVRKGINNPRYPTLPNVMKSKRIAIDKVERKVEQKVCEISYENKPEKKGATIISGSFDEMADKFISILKDEYHII